MFGKPLLESLYARVRKDYSRTLFSKNLLEEPSGRPIRAYAKGKGGNNPAVFAVAMAHSITRVAINNATTADAPEPIPVRDAPTIPKF